MLLDEPIRLSSPYPAVAVAAAGEAHVVWRRPFADGDALVSRRFVPAAGWGLTTTVVANGEYRHGMQYPALSVLGDGSVLAVWRGHGPDEPEHTHLQAIFYR